MQLNQVDSDSDDSWNLFIWRRQSGGTDERFDDWRRSGFLTWWGPTANKLAK